FSPTIFILFYYPATPRASTLSLHDALPILRHLTRTPHGSLAALRPQHELEHPSGLRLASPGGADRPRPHRRHPGRERAAESACRSEEHTSELQSRENLVCRLLLEKKK